MILLRPKGGQYIEYMGHRRETLDWGDYTNTPDYYTLTALMSLPLLCNSTDDEICGRDMELIELHKKIQPVGKRPPHGFALRRNHSQTTLPLFFGVSQ